MHYGTPIGGRVKTDLDAEAASRAKFEKAVGKEAVDAAMRIRDRLHRARPTGPRAAYLCHGFCELGAHAARARCWKACATSSSRTRARCWSS